MRFTRNPSCVILRGALTSMGKSPTPTDGRPSYATSSSTVSSRSAPNAGGPEFLGALPQAFQPCGVLRSSARLRDVTPFASCGGLGRPVGKRRGFVVVQEIAGVAVNGNATDRAQRVCVEAATEKANHPQIGASGGLGVKRRVAHHHGLLRPDRVQVLQSRLEDVRIGF